LAITTYLVDLRPRVPGVPEARERTVIHGIAAGRVGYTREGILLPVEVAGLEGGLEADEELEVRLEGVLLAAPVIPVVRVLVDGRAPDLRQLQSTCLVFRVLMNVQFLRFLFRLLHGIQS
jgi:hypothetical protein